MRGANSGAATTTGITMPRSDTSVTLMRHLLVAPNGGNLEIIDIPVSVRIVRARRGVGGNNHDVVNVVIRALVVRRNVEGEHRL